MKQISIRVPESVFRDVVKLSRIDHMERSFIFREALQRGICELKQKVSIELYKKGRLSISEAAGLADLSIGEMMDLLIREGVKSELAVDEFKRLNKSALKAIK